MRFYEVCERKEGFLTSASGKWSCHELSWQIYYRNKEQIWEEDWEFAFAHIKLAMPMSNHVEMQSCPHMLRARVQERSSGGRMAGDELAGGGMNQVCVYVYENKMIHES